jgi:hypothetical protein
MGKSPAQTPLQRVYNYIGDNNPDFQVDFDTFEKDMRDPEKFSRTHSWLTENNPDFQVDEETFRRDMFGAEPVKKKEPTSRASSSGSLATSPEPDL